MALTLPVTGRFKADGDYISEYRSNGPQLYRTALAHANADIAVRRDNSQAMGQPPKSRHAQPAVRQHQRHEHFRNPQRLQQRERISR